VQEAEALLQPSVVVVPAEQVRALGSQALEQRRAQRAGGHVVERPFHEDDGAEALLLPGHDVAGPAVPAHDVSALDVVAGDLADDVLVDGRGLAHPGPGRVAVVLDHHDPLVGGHGIRGFEGCAPSVGEEHVAPTARSAAPDAVGEGQRVESGDELGTVADYSAATGGVTPSHIHMGRR